MRALKIVLVTFIILAAVYGVLALTSRPRPAHAYYARFAGQEMVLAHGGGQGLWPDNTLTAFDGAAALGVDVLELDLQRDADGVFRVIHDATLDRTTSASGPVAGRSAADFALIDAGHRWTIRGQRADAIATEYVHRGAGILVPTLRDVLERFPTYAVNAEIKEDDAEAGRALCDLLTATGARARVLVASFHSAPMQAFRQACPDVATSATRSEVTLFYVLATARLAAVYSPPFDAVQVPTTQGGITVLTPQFVRAAHSRGVIVDAWTINDEPEMRRLLALGVDGLITDRPDRALRVLGREYDSSLVHPDVTP